MTLQEILKAKGLSDEDVESIVGDMKQNKIFTAGEENLDIRYSKLKTDHDNLISQHTEATNLIEQLKSDTKNNEALQGKITGYETTITQLQAENAQIKLDAAIQIALMDAKATDIPYMTFKLKEKGDLELDEHGHIKDIDDKLAGLKTQYPTQFETSAMHRQIEVQKLPDRNNVNNLSVTKEEFNKMGYNSRVELKQNNPELYAQMMKG